MPEVWIKAKHENWARIDRGVDWEYDQLTIYQTGVYQIVVNEGGKLKTYKGRLSAERQKVWSAVVEQIQKWIDGSRDRLSDILGWCSDGSHWDLVINCPNGKKLELDWQVLKEYCPISRFLIQYERLKKSAKPVKIEDIFFPE